LKKNILNHSISHIEYYLPVNELTNIDLAQKFDKESNVIFKNTGISKRHIRSEDEIGSDLGFQAAKKIIENYPEYKNKIDFLIFCTEGLDFKAPTTSSTLHYKLGLKEKCGCIDMPMGCAGFVYGLSIANAMLLSGNTNCVLFIVADIPSSVVHSEDFEMRALFGDAGAAIVVEKSNEGKIGKFVFGNDGSGAKNLIVERGSTRNPLDFEYLKTYSLEPGGLVHGRMSMNGLEITRFSLEKVPALLVETLEINNLNFEEIDLFVFHQASSVILNALKRKCKIPDDKFYVYLENVGNTVSCTIPIALYHAEKEGKIKPGSKVLILGFGVGYSWSGTVITW
jgi:3-oxoacyl-[acyl-carrier-protein] synthase-3